MLWAEYAGVGLGLAYLLLAIREYRSCWIAGALASVLFGFVFWDAGLPMQALLQVYYVAVAVHGWFHWGPDNAAGSPAPHRLPGQWNLALLLLLFGLSAATALLRGGEPSIQLWADSTTSWAGVIATALVARKVLEAWLYWVIIDLATAALYFHAGLLASSGLYLVYAILALVAWKEWLNHFRQRNGP